MSNNVTQFPRFRIRGHVEPDGPIQSVPITRRPLPDPKPVVDRSKPTPAELGEMAKVLGDLRLEVDHVMLKLARVSECFGELAWAARVVEKHAADIKALAEKQP